MRSETAPDLCFEFNPQSQLATCDLGDLSIANRGLQGQTPPSDGLAVQQEHLETPFEMCRGTPPRDFGVCSFQGFVGPVPAHPFFFILLGNHHHHHHARVALIAAAIKNRQTCSLTFSPFPPESNV